MQQSEPPRRDEQRDENAYAPPRAALTPVVDQNPTDHAENQRRKHLRREACIRVAGLIGLFLAGFVVLTVGFGALSERHRQQAEGIEPWMYRRWVARMVCVGLIAVLAFATSWGLFRLRNWGRWALTVVTTLPVPALVCGWHLRILAANPGVQEKLNPAALTTLSALSALSCPLLLFLMWSPRGEMVFSAEYSETIRRTPRSRPGCSGIMPALAALTAELASYLVLLLTVLSILAMLGLITSI
jgi:hypothetical protein